MALHLSPRAGPLGEGHHVDKQNVGFGLLWASRITVPAFWGSPGAGHTKPVMSTPSVSSQVHAYIISSLKKEMPNVFGKESKKKELVNNLGEIYAKIEREHQISAGDFPSLRKMQVRRRCTLSRLVAGRQ